MRLWLPLLLALGGSLHANHPGNIFEKLDAFTPVMEFTETVSQTVVSSGGSRETVDNYSGSFRLVVENDNLASLNAASVVRIRIGTFLLDTALGIAPDYTAGGDHATFSVMDGADMIGKVKLKWAGEILSITGSIKSRIMPGAAASFHIAGLEEDARYFVSEATDVSVILGAITGAAKLEVSGKSSFSHFRVGPAAIPTYEDDLWKVTVSGSLDFKAPKLKLLSPGPKTSASPQRYVISTSPDVDVVNVQLNSVDATAPTSRDFPDPLVTKRVARVWDGLFYPAEGANTLKFTAVDRSGNSSVSNFTLSHDFRRGSYTGILDTGTDDMTRTLFLKVGDGGSFTGILQLGLEKFRLKGLFDAAGGVTFSAPRPKGGTALGITLTLTQDDSNFTGEPDPKPTVLTANITDVFGSYSIDATRSVFDTEEIQPSLLAGYYTARIAPDPLLEGSGAPEGTGFLSIKVTGDGSVRTVGKVADGSAFTQSGPIGGDGRHLIAAKLYAPADGFIQGFLAFSPAESNGSTCAGTLRWVQPPGAKNSSGLFPDGINSECEVSGGIYLPGSRIKETDGTITDTTPLGTDAANISFLHGEIGDDALIREFDINYKAAVRLVSPVPGENLKLSIKNASGIFGGSIKVPEVASPSKKFFGIIVGQEGIGEGTFISKTDSGLVTLESR